MALSVDHKEQPMELNLSTAHTLTSPQSRPFVQLGTALGNLSYDGKSQPGPDSAPITKTKQTLRPIGTLQTSRTITAATTSWLQGEITSNFGVQTFEFHMNFT